MEVCRGPECTREVTNKKRGLCQAHAQQEIRGIDLHPLNSNRGGANRKYQEGDVCKAEGCTRAPQTNWMCGSHDWQMKKYGQTYEIGKGGRPGMSKGFSTERWCEVCKETKNWRKYHLEQNMCTECYRLSLSKRVDVVVDRTTKPAATWQDLLKFIDSQTRTN